MLDTVTREKPPSTGADLPPLTSGDHLSLAEFERRYRAHPEIKKAELVEGVVYVSSADYIAHARIHSYIDLWLGNYVAQTPGLEIANNLSVLLDLDNEVQPDVCAWRQESPSVTFDAHGMMVGAPDFVGEVAASSAANDLHKKKLYIDAARSPNTSCWLSMNRRCSGTICRMVPTCFCNTTLMVFIAAVFFRGCGWMQRRCGQGICNACWRQCRPVWLWWRERVNRPKPRAQIRPAKPLPRPSRPLPLFVYRGPGQRDRGVYYRLQAVVCLLLGRSSQTPQPVALG